MVLVQKIIQHKMMLPMPLIQRPKNYLGLLDETCRDYKLLPLDHVCKSSSYSSSYSPFAVQVRVFHVMFKICDHFMLIHETEVT